MTPQECAAAIGLTLKQCYSKANRLGLKSFCKPGHQKGWKPPPKLASRPCLPPSKPAKAAARGPAFQAGEPIITAATKRTYGVSPQLALKTNTFLE